MNIAKLLVLPAVVTLALFAGPSAPSGLSVNCGNGSGGSGCYEGHVTFTGTNYKNHTHVLVTRSDGSVYDDGFYQAPGGVLSFEENLTPPDTYTITTSVKGGHDVTDYVTVTTVPWN